MEIPLQRKRKVASTIDERHYTQHVDIQGYDNLKIIMYFSVIDRMMQELDSRFPESLTDFAFLKPKNMFTLDSEKRILDLAKRYPNLDSDRLLSQYKLNRNCVRNTKTIREVLNNINPDYKDLIEIYKLFLCLPVTTASTERSFSKLTLVKSKLRTTMTQERLE
ncbi:hypothetical protein QTP88_003420 [Uroleucon formosanum]